MNSTVQTTAMGELSALLIPVTGKQLVLPNVTVAEIIPFVKPETEDDMPNWYLGCFSWRSLLVPLVSFEAINEEPFIRQKSNRRIAVLNGLVGERLPFCGIVTEGAPRLSRIMPDEVDRDEEGSVGPAEIARVLVGGESAVIPDVDFIQHEMLKLL